jgi:hypothetical protein
MILCNGIVFLDGINDRILFCHLTVYGHVQRVSRHSISGGKEYLSTLSSKYFLKVFLDLVVLGIYIVQ